VGVLGCSLAKYDVSDYDGNSMGPIVLRSVIPSEIKLCVAERSTIDKIQHFVEYKTLTKCSLHLIVVWSLTLPSRSPPLTDTGW